MFSDAFIRDRVSDLLREAENDRLADLATGPGRPLRGRIADLLVAIAEWIDDRPPACPPQRLEGRAQGA
jgi:hypothetical protein